MPTQYSSTILQVNETFPKCRLAHHKHVSHKYRQITASIAVCATNASYPGSTWRRCGGEQHLWGPLAGTLAALHVFCAGPAVLHWHRQSCSTLAKRREASMAATLRATNMSKGSSRQSAHWPPRRPVCGQTPIICSIASLRRQKWPDKTGWSPVAP